MPSVAEAVAKKVMIIGLDCAEPSLVLERWRDELPGSVGADGARRVGRLTSIDPADHRSGVVVHDGEPDARATSASTASATAPTTRTTARSSPTSTRDPRATALGSRRPRGRQRRSWSASRAPIPRARSRGVMVSCFLTPSTESRFTYPPALKGEVEEVVGEYLFDCTNFRTEDKDDLLRQVYEMTDKRFALAEHLLATKPWQLFALRRDGHRPDPPRLLEVHGPRAPQARAGRTRTSTRSATTTCTSTGCVGATARARRRRDARARRLRPRREAARRRASA